MADIDQVPMPEVTELDNQSLFLRPARGELLRVAMLGAVLGILIPLISYILTRFFLIPIFCSSSDTQALCTNSSSVGYYVASVLMGVIAIVTLANWQVFRPLIIAVAAIISLWGFSHYVSHISGANAFEYYVLSVVLYAAAFLLFYWLMRIRRFVIGLVLAIIAIIVIRVALQS